jgi:hypothetical protein
MLKCIDKTPIFFPGRFPKLTQREAKIVHRMFDV